MLDVWMNVSDGLEDIIVTILAFEWAYAKNAADVH
jgi:hypothetical protein